MKKMNECMDDLLNLSHNSKVNEEKNISNYTHGQSQGICVPTPFLSICMMDFCEPWLH